jgi:hypothetical protein
MGKRFCHRVIPAVTFKYVISVTHTVSGVDTVNLLTFANSGSSFRSAVIIGLPAETFAQPYDFG